MSISNTELRRRVFGGERETATAKWTIGWPVPNPLAGPAAVLAAVRSRLASAFQDKSEIALEKPVLAERIAAQARAKVRIEPVGRLAFADAGKGVAVLLAAFLAIAGLNGHRNFGVGWIDALAQFLHPFAIPAFLVFTGMFLRQSRESAWSDYLGRKIAPLGGALVLWFAAVAVLAQMQFLRGGGSIVLAGLNHLHLAALLAVLPAFLLLWRVLRAFRTGTILVLAAIVELLHTEYGGIIWIEAMRGMAYLAAGHCFADRFRAIARFARESRPPALAILGVWAAFTALLVSADVPLAAGERISTLPFASLALGLSGAAALVIAGELLSVTRLGSSFAFAGRNWMALYAVIPLAAVVGGRLLQANGLFATPQEAIAALLMAFAGAGAVFFAFESRDPPRPSATASLRRT